jgi:hypothetical protein
MEYSWVKATMVSVRLQIFLFVLTNTNIRQTWYRFKQSYFNGVPTDEIRKTSHVSCMNDTQWCALVHM